jgi:hypothetical protein
MIRVRDLSAAEDATKSGAPAKADALRISGVEQIASSLGPEPLRTCRGPATRVHVFAVRITRGLERLGMSMRVDVGGLTRTRSALPRSVGASPSSARNVPFGCVADVATHN